MTLPRRYFDEMYAAAEDPWGFRSRWYEQRKYALTLASLPRARYRRGFEPGCSVGVLTAGLAERCDELLATDVAEAALATAGGAGLPGSVVLERRAVPADWPAGTFDLIVLSEVGYYLDAESMAELARRASGALEPDGHLVAVHWRPSVPDYPIDGAAVQQILRHQRGLELVAAYRDEYVLLDVFAAGPPGRLVGPDD